LSIVILVFIYYYPCVEEWRKEEARMPTVVYIGERLKEARTRKLLTQEELAELAGVSPSTVVNIERNNAEPHFRTIRKLAKALDVDPTSLLGE
jgi:DNA-binding XRE family transcriptional regulator